MADELKPFACTYRFEGRPIDFTVQARDWDEVSARLRAIGMTAVVVGEQIAEIDTGAFGEGFGRAIAVARSLTGKRRAKK